MEKSKKVAKTFKTPILCPIFCYWRLKKRFVACKPIYLPFGQVLCRYYFIGCFNIFGRERMKKVSNFYSQKRKGGTNSNEDVSEEEKEGEADQPEEVVVTDEENDGLPAPQIKVGPDGEITIDEKSLVIENKQVKRSKEKIQKSKLVDGDSATTYGVYKKVERTKLWSKRETLRFYKALNAIGTDFSLMLPLFPGRKRRDLTMKFKKEEKVNRTLIDRALMEPNTYDISELRREIELEEREEREKERVKREVEQLARKEAEEKRKKRGEKNTG